MPGKTDARASKDKARLLRSLRASISQLEWLEKPLIWTGSRLEFVVGTDTIFPTADMLALAQRQVNKISEYKGTLKQVVGDPEKWKRERAELMHRAKLANALGELDIASVYNGAKNGQSQKLATLISLLEIESIIRNSFRESPSRKIIELGLANSACEGELESFIKNGETGTSARALAAVCLGTIHGAKTGSKQFNFPKTLQDIEWYSRCYSFAREFQLDLDLVAITKALKKNKSGVSALKRLDAAIKSLTEIGVSAATVKLAIDRSANLESVANCFEALCEIDELTTVLMQYRAELDDDGTKKKPQYDKKSVEKLKLKSEELANRRQVLLAEFSDCMEDFIDASPTPGTLNAVRAFIETCLQHTVASERLFERILGVIREVILLQPHLQEPFLRLVVKHFEKLFYKCADGHLHTKDGTHGVEVLTGALLLMHKLADPRQVENCIERDLVSILVFNEIEEEKPLRFVLDTADRLKMVHPYHVGELCYLMERFIDFEEAQKCLTPAIREIEKAPEDMRLHFFEALDYTDGRKQLKQSMAATTRFIPHLINGPEKVEDDSCACFKLVDAAVKISKLASKHEEELFIKLMEIYRRKFPMKPGTANNITLGTRLGLAFIQGGVTSRDVALDAPKPNSRCSPADLLYFAIELVSNLNFNNYNVLLEGIDVLATYPRLVRLVARQFTLHPKRMTTLIERLSMVNKWGVEAKKPLVKLERFEAAMRFRPTETHGFKRVYAKGWGAVLKLVPDMMPEMLSFIISKSITGGAQGPQTQLLKLTLQPEAFAREVAHLERLVQSKPERADLQARLNSLRERLKNKTETIAQTQKLVRKHMMHLALDAELEAIEFLVREIYFKQLKSIVKSTPDDFKIDNDIINAVLLTQDIDENRRQLKRLIRAHIEGDEYWRQQMPANEKFLHELASKNIDQTKWLSVFSRTVEIPALESSPITIRLVKEPIKILQMGNYFDTCLSVGGPYSHSTIVNASELNKRVAFVYDRHERVIARKLIGLTGEFRLVGFKTYTAIAGEDAFKQVVAAVDEYMKSFAHYVGVETTDEGEVPVLTSGIWYDDGAVAWSVDDLKRSENADLDRSSNRAESAANTSRSKRAEKRV